MNSKTIKKMETSAQYIDLLTPLFADCDKKFEPVNEKQILAFSQKCKQRNVPVSVLEQLVEFYRVTNGVPCLNGFDFHKIDDEILFEWWNENELWLGGCNCDVLRWHEGYFCMGEASNITYLDNDDYKFKTLIELLKKGFQDWF